MLLKRRVDVRVVSTPSEADLILWNVWDFGLCSVQSSELKAQQLQSNSVVSDTLMNWEVLKGHKWGSCEVSHV